MMSRKLAAFLSLVGAAALGAWFHTKTRRRADVAGKDAGGLLAPDVEIDDDTAAEIIRRARPALERAREIS